MGNICSGVWYSDCECSGNQTVEEIAHDTGLSVEEVEQMTGLQTV